MQRITIIIVVTINYLILFSLTKCFVIFYVGAYQPMVVASLFKVFLQVPLQLLVFTFKEFLLMWHFSFSNHLSVIPRRGHFFQEI